MAQQHKLVLVTGGTGNMGRGVVDLLVRQGLHRIRVFVREQERKSPVVRRWLKNKQVELAWRDLTNAQAICKAVDGADVVLHLGGLVSPLADELPPHVVSEVNVKGTAYIVDAIKQSPKAHDIRLVYIGSVSQTGSRNPPINWGRTGDPIKVGYYGHYATTKAQGEAIVAESGLRYWVSLRQSGMAHYDLWRTSGPIIFHNPINGVFEWSTAADSARLMAAVCGEVPEEFWREFYNIGGGASARVMNHQFMVHSMQAMGVKDFRKVMDPNWSATRNFHGQWYADSDRLEALLLFREQSLQDFFAELPQHIPLGVRLFARLFPGLIHRQLEKIAYGPGGLMGYVKADDKPKIRAYFGSQSAWERIPDDWAEYKFATAPVEQRLLNHGYDDGIPKELWSLSDLQSAARFRGGRCLAEHVASPYAPVPWSCSQGHEFIMSPNLYLRGGHWCPTCQYDVEGYHRVARHNPFFAQVWSEELDAEVGT